MPKSELILKISTEEYSVNVVFTLCSSMFFPADTLLVLFALNRCYKLQLLTNSKHISSGEANVSNFQLPHEIKAFCL